MTRLEQTASMIPATTIASVTYSAAKLGTLSVCAFDLYHLMKAAGLDIPARMQARADERGWDSC